MRTTIGGEQLGYLVLIIAPTTYTSISGTAAFTRSTDPAVFAVTQAPLPPPTRANPIPDRPTLTNADIATQKKMSDKSLRLYNKYKAVDLALHNQITDVFEPE